VPGGGETPFFFLTFSLPGNKKGKSLTQKGDHFILRKKKRCLCEKRLHKWLGEEKSQFAR
jgi:hypothetical protein